MSIQSIIDTIRLVMYFILTIGVLVVSFFPEGWLLYCYLTVEELEILHCLLAPLYLFIAYCVTVIFFGVIHSQVVVRLTLPYRIKPGVYPHHSSKGRLIAIRLTADGIFKAMLKVFTFLPFIWGVLLFPYGMRLYGLKCGKNVHIATNTWIDCPLVEIGDNSFIGWNTALAGHANENRQFVIEPAKIGKNCTIGSYCVVAPGVEIGDDTMMGLMSGFKKGEKVPPGGIWVGAPAKLLKKRKGYENDELLDSLLQNPD
ncbi:MAG: acyltransferase [Candidatus Hodarchaeota archaeon]